MNEHLFLQSLAMLLQTADNKGFVVNIEKVEPNKAELKFYLHGQACTDPEKIQCLSSVWLKNDQFNEWKQETPCIFSRKIV